MKIVITGINPGGNHTTVQETTGDLDTAVYTAQKLSAIYTRNVPAALLPEIKIYETVKNKTDLVYYELCIAEDDR